MMLPHLERTFTAAQSAKDLAKQVQTGEKAPLRIGIAETMTTDLFYDLLDQVRRQVNGFELSLRKGSGQFLTDLAISGGLDVLFISARETLPERMRSWTLFCEKCNILVSWTDPLASRESVNLHDFLSVDLIDFVSCPDRQAFLELCIDSGVVPKLRHAVNSLEDLMVAVRMGLGVGLVSRHVSPIEGVVALPLAADDFEQETAVAIVAGRPFNRATEICLRLARARSYA
jgi:DNA-binding transcriptional LysR family regulator